MTITPPRLPDTDRPSPEPGPSLTRHREGLVIGMATVVAGVATIMAAYGEVFYDAAVITAVLIGAVVATTRTASTKLRWAFAGLMTVFLVINAMYAIEDLSHPESPTPFIGTTLVVLGGLVTVVLAVAAARRRRLPIVPIWAMTFVAFGGLGVVSLVLGASVTDDTAEPGDAEIVAEDIAFPDEVVLAADGTGMVVRNADLVRHTIAIEGEVDAVELPATSSTRVALDLAPGTYRFFCTVTGHESMEGTLVVG